MGGGPRRRRTLGRGLGDLVGNDLESLVREATPGPEDAAAATQEPKPGDPAPHAATPGAGALPPPGRATGTDPVRASAPPFRDDAAGTEAPATSPIAPPRGGSPARDEPWHEQAPRSGAGAEVPDSQGSRAFPAGPSTERAAPRTPEPPDPPTARGTVTAPVPDSRSAGKLAEGRRLVHASPLPAWGPPAEAERATGHPRVFAVASGKGGTGKSLVAVNLAVSMAERSRICLIDADFGLGNAHILLGVLPRWNVAHLVRGERTLDEILVEGPRGLRLLPGASGVPEMASLDDAALDALASTLGRLLDRFDAAILDCPAGLTRQSLVMLHAADVVIVVTTDDLTSMTDAYALIKTLVTHRPDLAVGVLVNDARSASEGAETYRRISHVARKFLGRELVSLGTIPADSQLEKSVMERRPAVLAHPRSAAARAIEELALRLISLQGKGPSASFPERMHRTLAASAVAPGHGRHGEGLCMS